MNWDTRVTWMTVGAILTMVLLPATVLGAYAVEDAVTPDPTPPDYTTYCYDEDGVTIVDYVDHNDPDPPEGFGAECGETRTVEWIRLSEQG